MDNKQKYDKVFMDCFTVEISDLGDDLAYQSVPEWDSIGHMQMITAIEDAFDIIMETDDIIDFSSYEKGREILANYNILIQEK